MGEPIRTPSILYGPAIGPSEKNRFSSNSLSFGKTCFFIIVSIFPFEGSGRLSSLSWSNGIVELSEEERNIDMGDLVDFIPYGSFFQ